MLLLPHFWVGICLICGVVGQLAFPLVSQRVVGIVIDKGTRATKKGERHYQVVGYELDHLEKRTTLTISADEYRTVRAGDPVALSVAPVFGRSIARDANDSSFPFLLFPALLWNFIVGIFVRELAWHPLSRFWLIKRGVQSEGFIDEVTRTVGKGGGALVNFHFTPLGQATVEGSMKVTHDLFDNTPLPKLTIFHHPRWPRINVVYELSSWEI